MSRCFPYPPPGYVRKVARTEAALIESIKLQSERRQHKTDSKKEKSKHKKEKSKDRKHKSKERKERKEKSSRSLNDQKQKACVKEAKDRLEGTKVEAEQLEKSGLTEEHGQPVWPHSPGYLSDGTQINHKRKRDSLQPDEGKVIRIKLASSLSQQENSSAGSEQTCSVSGRDCSRDENSSVVRRSTCFANSETALAVKDCTSSKPKIKDPPPHAVKEISSLGNVMSLPRTRSPVESAYEALFEKWVPPPLQLEQQMDDEEWLFPTEKQDGRSSKTNEAFSSIPSCRSSSLWPRGQYLADADVYSLPYTIPY
ncbi:uncharacterized protein LOC111462522 isoform X2 [Cucurbita moschata]|uniref:Uncharacterized protein LOC111462522 isoform X2 n=1 Tax=Cucurbita moschata TaxID=3662 RepID=A0A6J1HD43_CUCMO|nr:uncharacterized protein LOC111462522 isoform X2 [Cucurbita moschata]